MRYLRRFENLVTQVCTVAVLCVKFTDMETSNIMITDSNAALDPN